MSRSLAAIALCLLCLTACGGSDVAQGSSVQHATTVLDWYPNSDHGGLYTAIQRGYFRKHGIAMTAHAPSDTTAQIRLVAAGKADFGISYEADLLSARAQGIPVRSLMCLVQHPLNTVMSLRSSHITRPRDLVGKTVGVAGSPSDIPLLSALMRHDGASVSRVRIVNVGYNLNPALLAGKVDAVIGVYWTWEAIEAQMKGKPVNVMRVERWGAPNYCELVLVTSESTIKDRPALVSGTVQGLQQGYAYAEAHPVAAWKALHAASSALNRTLILRSLKLLRPAITDTPTIGRQDSTQWRRYAAWLHASGLLTGSTDVAAAFTNRFLRPNVR